MRVSAFRCYWLSKLKFGTWESVCEISIISVQAFGSYHGRTHSLRNKDLFLISRFCKMISFAWLAHHSSWSVCDGRTRARTWCCCWVTTVWKSCRWSLRCSWTSLPPRHRPAASTPAPSSTLTTTIGQFYFTAPEIRKENLCTWCNNEISMCYMGSKVTCMKYSYFKNILFVVLVKR